MNGSEVNRSRPDFLVRMTKASRDRVRDAQARLNETELRRVAEETPAAPPLRLSAEGFDLVAEVKFRAPSVGTLADQGRSPTQQAHCYVQGGAAALSVLTEPAEFAGELAHLEQVTAALPQTPVMRKDFLVSPYQILEARAAGAAGVLVVVAMLDDAEITDMLQMALDLGMFALVEAFDAADLERCLPLMQAEGDAISAGICRQLIGVNCRNLRTLGLEFERFGELVGDLPEDIPRVAESGVESPAQAAELAQMGYQMALVGTTLMRAADPATTARAIIAAGRGA